MPEPDAPATHRLVIRIKLPREGLPPAPVRRRPSRGALALMVGAAAVLLLSWVCIRMFSTPDSAPQSPVSTPAPSQPAPVASSEPLPKPVAEPAVANSAPNSHINEVLPDVPRSALETIRGTIRVTIRVIVGRDGTVIAATPEVSGPSRYFARLALEASKKWTFAPIDSDEQRVMLVRFSFKRAGVTASASSAQ